MLEESFIASEIAELPREILGLNRHLATVIGYNRAMEDRVGSMLASRSSSYRKAVEIEKSRKKLSRPFRVMFAAASMMFATGLGLGYVYADQESSAVTSANHGIEAQKENTRLSAVAFIGLGGAGIALTGSKSSQNRFAHWRARRRLIKKY